MKLCDDGHDEIVYDNRVCPLCAALDKLKEAENEIEDLNKELAEEQGDDIW